MLTLSKIVKVKAHSLQDSAEENLGLELHDVVVDALKETTTVAKKEEALRMIKTVSSFSLLYSSALH